MIVTSEEEEEDSNEEQGTREAFRVKELCYVIIWEVVIWYVYFPKV